MTPKGKARGECWRILPGRYQNANNTLPRQSSLIPGTKQRSKRSRQCAFETKHLGAALHMIEGAAESLIGPSRQLDQTGGDCNMRDAMSSTFENWATESLPAVPRAYQVPETGRRLEP